MIKFQDLITEGVLILVSAKEMRNYYQNREYDYRFPNAMTDLIKEGHLMAIVTEESIEKLEIIFENEDYSLEDYQFMGENNYLKVQENDTIFLLDHSAFTEICDWHKGNYELHTLPDDLVEIPIKSGFYRIKVYKKPPTEDDYRLYMKLVLEQTQGLDKELISVDPLEVFVFTHILI